MGSLRVSVGALLCGGSVGASVEAAGRGFGINVRPASFLQCDAGTWNAANKRASLISVAAVLATLRRQSALQ